MDLTAALTTCLGIDIPDLTGDLSCSEAIVKAIKSYKAFDCKFQAFYFNHGEYPEGCEDIPSKQDVLELL